MSQRINRGFVVTMVSLLAFAAMVTTVNRKAFAEDRHHEKIDSARDALHDAYKELDEAPNDFEGHKKEAMEKIDDADKSLDHWHDHVHEAIEKVNKAVEQLRVCKEKNGGHHPRIEKAIDALEAAKDELKD
jgi:uncharacterized coiled-coil DUF342 family protein